MCERRMEKERSSKPANFLYKAAQSLRECLDCCFRKICLVNSNFWKDEACRLFASVNFWSFLKVTIQQRSDCPGGTFLYSPHILSLFMSTFRRDCHKVCDVIPIWAIIMSRPSLTDSWPFGARLQTLFPSVRAAFTESTFSPALISSPSMDKLWTASLEIRSKGLAAAAVWHPHPPCRLIIRDKRPNLARTEMLLLCAKSLPGGELFISRNEVASLPSSLQSN